MTALDICRYEHDIVQQASLEYKFAKYCTVTVKFLATKDVPTDRTVTTLRCNFPSIATQNIYITGTKSYLNERIIK